MADNDGNDVYILTKRLDEKVARLHLDKNRFEVARSKLIKKGVTTISKQSVR